MKNILNFFLLFLLVIFSIAGCSGGGNKSSNNGSSCTSNAQCLNGQICQNGSCVTSSSTVPLAPTNLTAIAGNQQVSLTWNTSTGATSYNVYESTTLGGPYTKLGFTTATPYSITNLTNGMTYYFVVTAVSSGGESGYSNEASAIPDEFSPNSPSNLTAFPGDTQVMLTWYTAYGAASYNVYYSIASNGAFIKLGSTTSLSYTVTGLLNNVPYYFVITAVNWVGESGYSNEVIATPNISSASPPLSPTNLTAIAYYNQIALSWVFSNGATSYNVYTSTTYGGLYTKLGFTAATSDSVTGLTSNSDYCFVVTAANGAGESGFSNQVCATPHADTYFQGTAMDGIAIDSSGNIWVTNNSGTNTVTKLSPSGTAIGTYSVGQYPQDIAIDSSGNIWVTNSVSNNVTELNSMGVTIGTYTVGNTPKGIAIDASGNIWVPILGIYPSLGAVIKLSSSGITIGTYPVSSSGSIAIDNVGNVWVAGMHDTVTKLSSSGITIGTYTVSSPGSIAIDNVGNVWVANYGSNSVTELSSSGITIGTYTVSSPGSIAIDNVGNVWVANSRNTVTELSPTGTTIGTYSCGSGSYGGGIAIDTFGNLWFATYGGLYKMPQITTGPQYFPYTGPQFPGGGNW